MLRTMCSQTNESDFPRMQHLMTPPTDQTVTVRINELAWHEGMRRAMEGGSTFDNPYLLGTAEAYSWLSGFIGSTDAIGGLTGVS